MIVTEGLTKRYGEFSALSDLTLEIRKGEVFGLLGPNGSGKTTTIRLLLGMLRPTWGRAEVAGHDCWSDSLAVRDIVSYLPGELRMFGWMTGRDMLRFFSDLRGGVAYERAVALADQVMKLDLRKKVRTYSTGMKQKLALAQAFADPVDILILDEPTSALDPSARSEVLALVREARKQQGQTIIFSGHVLSEVEEVADRVAIMRRGKLMHLEDLHQRRTNLRLVLARFNGHVPDELPSALELSVRERNGDVWLMEHRGPAAPLLSWLGEMGVVDVAIGTEDLRTLYDQFHGPNAKDEDPRG
ncbi:ABC transporter ATP-binding protein [Singulisphaera sp. PoT]|uniref:ABC transporter ATP-binding protein n=1 Tax=Singulisphaera sp. PoT TaxID=3411797 RepID=UPI003BF57540